MTPAHQASTCATVVFDGQLPPGWDPTIRDGFGGGSGLPGLHIQGPEAYISIALEGHVFGPIDGVPVDVDGVPGLLGPIEDGIGVRFTTSLSCDPLDLLAYGVTENELRVILNGTSFVSGSELPESR